MLIVVCSSFITWDESDLGSLEIRFPSDHDRALRLFTLRRTIIQFGGQSVDGDNGIEQIRFHRAVITRELSESENRREQLKRHTEVEQHRLCARAVLQWSVLSRYCSYLYRRG
jgi:hypothetical protein